MAKMEEYEKEQLKQKAQILRDAADILDQICETDDAEQQEELSVKFFVKMMKMQQ